MSDYFSDDFMSESSDDDFMSEEEIEEENDDEIQEKPEPDQTRKVASRFLNKGAQGYDDSDSDDDKHTIRSEKDKRFEVLENICNELEDLIDESDWSKIFDKLKLLEKNIKKSSGVLKKFGYPTFLLDIYIELVDVTTQLLSKKENTAKYSRNNKKNLNKTFIAVTEIKIIDLQKALEFFQKDPDAYFDMITDLESGEGEEQLEEEEEVEEAWTPERIEEVLTKLISNRGRKNYDRTLQVKNIEELVENSKSSKQIIRLLFHLINAQFDCAGITFLSSNIWLECYHSVVQALELVKESELELVSKALDVEDEEKQIVVAGSFIIFLEKLNTEYFKSLQNTEPYKKKYIVRMREVGLLINLSEKLKTYYVEKNDILAAARAEYVVLENIYYKTKHQKYEIPNTRTLKFGEEEEEGNNNNNEEEEAEVEEEDLGSFEIQFDVTKRIKGATTLIFKDGTDLMKAHAMLYMVYHLALIDNFVEARDHLLMSHIQHTVQNAAIQTQILYNRTIVQIGLSAFRCNNIKEAHNCLNEVCNGNIDRIRELLAQGLTRYSDKTISEQKEEKLRQIPYHMHINIELLESVHLTSTILLEVPILAINNNDTSKYKSITRAFKRLLDHNKRQPIVGPPVTTRDSIVAAAKALMDGNWKRTVELILGLNVWSLLPKCDDIKAMLKQRIKEEGLRTYLFTYSKYYDSMSLTDLSTMFELEENTVHSIISKMMINEKNEKLNASWDQPTNCIIMHKSEPSRLQSLALGYSDKISYFVETNEKLMDWRTGGYGYKHYDKQSNNKSDYHQRKHYNNRKYNKQYNNNNNYNRSKNYSNNKN